MYLLKNSNSTVWVKLVIFSLFLVSFGIILNNAYAMGPPPGSCTNQYNAYVTNATIVAGNQIYHPMKNSVNFQLLNNQTFHLAVTVKAANQSSQGNSQPGQIWTTTNSPGYDQNWCSATISPNQNITYDENVNFPSPADPYVNLNYTYYWGSTNGITFNVYWKTVSPQPSIPNLHASPVNGQILLSWTASSNNGGSPVTNYQIWRGTSSFYETLLTQIGNVTSFHDSAVTNGQTYYYEVLAVNSAGEKSYFSNEVSATPTSPQAKVTISVKSVDLSGNPITGMWTVLRYSNGTTITSGYTPVSFKVPSGVSYVVHVGNHGTRIFNHWQDGSSSSYHTFTPTQNVALIAYYSTS